MLGTLTLFLVPVLAIIAALYLYQHTGKKEFLRFDLVQFVYAFVLTPIVYVWMKSFLFVFLVKELDLRLTVTEIFLADTVFTVIFLFFYAFLVIHSLTKSFELKRSRDPLYDLFQHSEFFHLLTSHVAIYIGLVVLISILSTVNIFIPLDFTHNMIAFYACLGFGFLVGLFVYVGILLTDDDFELQHPRFEMFIELLYASFFIYHISLFFYFRPAFNMTEVVFWFVFMILFGFIISSYVLERSEKFVTFMKQFHYKEPRFKLQIGKKKKD